MARTIINWDLNLGQFYPHDFLIAPFQMTALPYLPAGLGKQECHLGKWGILAGSRQSHCLAPFTPDVPRGGKSLELIAPPEGKKIKATYCPRISPRRREMPSGRPRIHMSKGGQKHRTPISLARKTASSLLSWGYYNNPK